MNKHKTKKYIDNFEDAIEFLTKGIDANPMDADLLFKRAVFYVCENKLEKALVDYHQCCLQQPNMVTKRERERMRKREMFYVCFL